MTNLDIRWVEEVCRICDPVFEAADVGFVRQLSYTDMERQQVTAVLWEADPGRFAAKYPDSGIVESYGDQWPAPCIDYWVYLEREKHQCRVNVEGWNLLEIVLEMSGEPGLDGIAIADTMARILGVPSPRL